MLLINNVNLSVGIVHRYHLQISLAILRCFACLIGTPANLNYTNSSNTAESAASRLALTTLSWPIYGLRHRISSRRSRLTARLDSSPESPRVQMHRFDPLPLISSPTLLITLRFPDYSASLEPTDFPSKPKESSDVRSDHKLIVTTSSSFSPS